MAPIRIAFICALAVSVVGFLAGRSLAEPLFASGDARTPLVLAARVVATVAPTPQLLQHSTVTPTVRPALRHHPVYHRAPLRHHPRAHRARAPRRDVVPHPTATPLTLTGAVTLDRYWVGLPSARAGSNIALGYVIDNTTGRGTRVVLGASIKPSRILSWTASIADYGHEVTAIVPPGITTHIRYFTLPITLRAGLYDVAWGLRNALNGVREALVSSPGSLTIVR